MPLVNFKLPNNQDKVKMKHFYHIKCDYNLDKVSVLCNAYLVLVIGVLNNSPNPGYPNWIKPSNHVILSNLKHVGTLPSYVAIINGLLKN